MALQQWAVPQLQNLLSMDQDSSKQIVSYTEKLSDAETTEHLKDLLGDTPEAQQFITSFKTMRSIPGTTNSAAPLPPAATLVTNGDKSHSKNPFLNGLNGISGHDEKLQSVIPNGSCLPPGYSSDTKTPAPAIPSSSAPSNGDSMTATDFPRDTKGPISNPAADEGQGGSTSPTRAPPDDAAPPSFAPPSYAPPPSSSSAPSNSASGFAPPAHPPPSAQISAALRRKPHTNPVIEAALIRAKDEQEMQNLLQNLQMKYGIYNSDVEPEHDADYYCNCPIHQYMQRKWNRLGVQDKWSKSVIYPGEKSYNDDFRMTMLFSSNPYYNKVVSPYGYNNGRWFQQSPQPGYHAANVRQTIQLNAKLNTEAQQNVDGREPKVNIWQMDQDAKFNGDVEQQAPSDQKQSINDYPADKKQSANGYTDEKKQSSEQQYPDEKASSSKRRSIFGSNSTSNGVVAATPSTSSEGKGKSKLGGLFKAMTVSTSDEKSAGKTSKQMKHVQTSRAQILTEEEGRWPDQAWREIVKVYQEKIGMASKVADLRTHQPIQYFHLLRAGYFEPIPVAWANLASNPLKFSIEAAGGWRGITPSWRGYEDTAEERLYWILNHREGSVGMRMKPDQISEMNMARARMETAVEPPPEYFSSNDTCHIQRTSEGYSRQVMPTPFRAYGRPETPNDDTMILLDVSGSMDFDPVRPIYDQYMITGYVRGTQPKNKDVTRAIIRRFTDAMANHDHTFNGYYLVTFSSQAHYIGSITHKNLDQMWNNVRIGGGTRVMTGWQKVKEKHFQKHSESATHHPIYGWQAGPFTPILRLLLLLDGEATDMDEFELDLLGLSWAHVTIFLIGVDGCPHHHRHANELQRISNVNHHVSFVDAQGNAPERFVTHELLKRHLGYDVTLAEFERMEELPAYS